MGNKYDTLVVLGKNWRRYPKKDDEKIHLSIDSKLSSLAAAELLSKGKVNRVIFSGGNTAGKNHPSEAEAMKDYMLRHYDVEESKIGLEDRSLDTGGNAEEVKKMLENNTDNKNLMMTVSYHSPRAKRIFGNYGLDLDTVSSEEILDEYGNRKLKNFVGKYSRSCSRLFESAKEALVLRPIQYFDKKEKLLHKAVNYIRGDARD